MIRKIATFISLLSVTSASAANFKIIHLNDEKKAIEAAHEAIEPIKKHFIESLTNALKKAPTQQACDKCRIEKPFLPSIEVSAYGRTSHKLRNPSNAPREWMKPYLEKYKTTNVSQHHKNELVKLSEDHYGYLEPIYMEPVCLKCHGKAIEASVEKALLATYPEDAAKGFDLGDFRGFIWMEMKAKEK